jgi:hypothetical protein
MRAIFGLVDALQIRDCLADGQNKTQVVRSRLALHDDMAAVVVDVDFALVHPAFTRNHLVHQILAAVGKSVDGGTDLGLDQAAHLQHSGTQRFQVLVVFLGEMFALPHGASFSRTGQ